MQIYSFSLRYRKKLNDKTCYFKIKSLELRIIFLSLNFENISNKL